MESLEEKLLPFVWYDEEGFAQILFDTVIDLSKRQVEKFAIGFADWIENNCFMDWDEVDKLFYNHNGKMIYSKKELLELYKQHLKTKDNGQILC